VSVASAAVGLAKQITPELNTVLVVGAGDTVDLLLRYLKTHNPKRIMIVNRSLENAEVLAKKHEIESIDFSKLHEALAVADIVISATGSALPIITKTMMQSVMPQRQQAAITMLDIAVPRDVDVTVGELAAVRLYCIDDLKSIIQHNLRGREHAADKAREVIIQKTSDFMAWQKSLDLVAVTIRAYRSQVEELCQAELIKATKQLQRGDDPLQVMSLFAYSFMNKLLHTPSVQLRQAGVDGRFDILQLAQQLFAIPQSESELI
jgi:glutamyl-tRNA reductase